MTVLDLIFTLLGLVCFYQVRRKVLTEDSTAAGVAGVEDASLDAASAAMALGAMSAAHSPVNSGGTLFK